MKDGLRLGLIDHRVPTIWYLFGVWVGEYEYKVVSIHRKGCSNGKTFATNTRSQVCNDGGYNVDSFAFENGGGNRVFNFNEVVPAYFSAIRFFGHVMRDPQDIMEGDSSYNTDHNYFFGQVLFDRTSKVLAIQVGLVGFGLRTIGSNMKTA